MIPLVKKIAIFHLIHLTITVTTTRTAFLSSQDHHLNKRGSTFRDCLDGVVSLFKNVKDDFSDQVGGVSQKDGLQQWTNAVSHDTFDHNAIMDYDEFWKPKTFARCCELVLARMLGIGPKSNEGRATLLDHFSKKLLGPISKPKTGTKSKPFEKKEDEIFDPLYMAEWQQSKPSGAPSASANLDESSAVEKAALEKIQENPTETLKRCFLIPDDQATPPPGFVEVSDNVKKAFFHLNELIYFESDLTEWPAMILGILVVTLGQEVFDSPEWVGWRDILFGQLVSLAYFEGTEAIKGGIAVGIIKEQQDWWGCRNRIYASNVLKLAEKDWWINLQGIPQRN
ncbi:hypothetical protein PTTG_29196 [Puccinia triticina 1-1 BBBD Race 1]|uniref:Uncharacterized protein n=1 Tax=Puccinia triticina (isolate 1-1 / race 1 (BBBD)) TaxID=630390 RepID=A0A180G6L1_PUCT1|nr:hypothetical protein PTTG_29196 [Puccinia triticina 1-1 BBBD Race 1]